MEIDSGHPLHFHSMDCPEHNAMIIGVSMRCEWGYLSRVLIRTEGALLLGAPRFGSSARERIVMRL
ncbi:MAG TPA: hypothetical protein VN039_16760, partial [Nitrospira sp.]|nr:hypothetical protein [Nitrospira sp.]